MTNLLRPGARALAICVVGLCLCTADSSRAQSGRPLSHFLQTQEWIRLAKAHQMGHVDDPLRTLASWSPAQIQRVAEDERLIGAVLESAERGQLVPQVLSGRVLSLADLPSLLDMEADDLFAPGRPVDPAAVADPTGQPRFEIARVMVRVAMLYTDLLIASRDERSSIRLSGLPSTTLRVDDTRRSTVPDATIYWDTARLAIDLVAPTPRGRALATDWYRVTSEYLQAQRDYALVRPHLEHARDVLPGDPRLALYLGAAYENLASPGIQAAIPDDEAALSIGSRPMLLARAEFQLRSALLLEPGFGEATLHLARILEMTGRYEEALPLLQPLDTSLPRPELRYLAALFSGRAHEAAGRRDEARASFERALTFVPDAQSARLALAVLMFRASGQATALPYVRPPGADRPAVDPWWTYDVSHVAGMSAHVEAFRAAAAEVLR